MLCSVPFEFLLHRKIPGIREYSQRGMFVEGLQEVLVSSAEATYFVFKTGAQNRQTGLTAMNEESSRSHSVFTITMESQVRWSAP